jgi:hypothetical protein
MVKDHHDHHSHDFYGFFLLQFKWFYLILLEDDHPVSSIKKGGWDK